MSIPALDISFILAVIITMLTVEAVDVARGKVISVDKLYKAVFA